MRARVLPVAEWDRLKEQNPALLSLLRTMRPETATALVVEDEGEIVASWGKCEMTHLEGLKIDNRMAGIRLLRLASEVVGDDPWVVTSAESAQVRDMIKRFGGEQVPVDTFVLSLKRRVA